jgi:hypothetical protein
MQLMTQEIEQALLTADHDAPAERKPVVVKFFTPDANATWYIVDAEREDGDLRMFGFCDLFGDPMCAELGYVMLSELTNVRGPFGLSVERDLYYSPQTLADVLRQYHKL